MTQAMAINLDAGECVEVCRNDTLIGYAIHFSGGWDAWSLMSNCGRSAVVRTARTVAINTTREAAIAAIAKDWLLLPPALAEKK